jgi:hypothetical protein
MKIESIHIKFNENTNKEVENDINIASVKISQVDDDRAEHRLIKINKPLSHSFSAAQEDPFQIPVQKKYPK